jgi:hypothetical protein
MLAIMRLIPSPPVIVLALSVLLPAAARPASAQARSGPRAVDACSVLTQAELKEALGRPVRSSPVPASQPASIGVSVCMWATADGRRTLSVTTYAPEAVKRTHAGDLKTYYESVKTSNANLARRAAIVLPGVARHASYFVNPRGTGDVILVLRRDCVVTINASGLSRDEITKVARAAGN